MKLRSILIAFVLAAASSSLSAQTLHFLIIADTADQSIGSSVGADVSNMEKKAREIASASGMRLNLRTIKSPEFNSDSTLKAVQQISPAANDTVFFYYSGHGYRTRETRTKWPIMYTKRPLPGVEFQKVIDILDQKNPRLVIALGDLCNSFSDQSERSSNLRAFAEIEVSNYKKLFVNFSGRVYASGSKPGQYSFAMEDGGAFTNQWLQALGNELRAPDPNWKRLMAVAVKPIHIGSPEQPTQDPIFELIEGKQVVAENMDETPETPPTPTDQQELKEDQAVVTQEIEEAEEEEEEYEDNQFCSDVKELVAALNKLDGALKPGLRLNRGDQLYTSLESVNSNLENVAEAYGDAGLSRHVRGLGKALQANNLRAYKASLTKVIGFFTELSGEHCSE
jgi:hypothetical protein